MMLLVLTGCGVRLDLPPAPAPVPEGQDAVRQESALTVELIAESAQAAARDAPEQVAPLLQAVADDARAHLDALGGVWQPPPRPDDGSDEIAAQQPDDGADEAAGAGAADVLGLLETASTDFPGHAGAVDEELATLLVSISVNQHLHARDLRSGLELEALEAPEAGADPFPETLGQGAAPVVRILDARGYIAEVRAGRASGDEAAQLADQAGRLRAQAEELAARAGISGTAQDPREVAYELDLEDLPGQDQDLALALVPAWLDLLAAAEGDDRDLIAAQVLITARAVHGRDEPVPTFPGRAG